MYINSGALAHEAGGVTNMATGKSKHKNYVLDESKIRRAQRLLGTQTETETIERALEEVISERERSRSAPGGRTNVCWTAVSSSRTCTV